MNRKAIYAEAKRRTASRYGVFTPEALRAHVLRSGGKVHEDTPEAREFWETVKAAPMRSGIGSWSSAGTDVAGNIERLRESQRLVEQYGPPPPTMNLQSAAHLWGHVSRHYPASCIPLRAWVGDGRWWQGDLTARTT